jgi:N-acetylglucosamine-6-phosphate deacetylase
VSGVQLLSGGQVLSGDGRIAPADVLIDDGEIRAVERAIEAPEGATRVDCAGSTLVPGFIDLHVHGGGGFSLMTKKTDDIAQYSGWVTSTGVSCFLATIVGETLDEGLECLQVVAGAQVADAECAGVNLEGPFVSLARPGALPQQWLREPSLETFARLQKAAGNLRTMTIAPELPGAEGVIRTAIDEGVVVAIGHTDATYAEAHAAFQWGASHLTHAFNAMRPLHHREPGPLAAALEFPNVTIEVIADGVHLHPATVRLLVQAFGPERICLVTDAVAPAGLQAGIFRLGGREARLENGAIRLPDGTLAGSALTMDQAVRNVVEWGVADLSAAVVMASTTPARVLGSQHAGTIAPGYRADLVATTEDLRVARTWVGGRLVYEARPLDPEP